MLRARSVKLGRPEKYAGESGMTRMRRRRETLLPVASVKSNGDAAAKSFWPSFGDSSCRLRAVELSCMRPMLRFLGACLHRHVDCCSSPLDSEVHMFGLQGAMAGF